MSPEVQTSYLRFEIRSLFTYNVQSVVSFAGGIHIILNPQLRSPTVERDPVGARPGATCAIQARNSELSL